MNVLQFTHYGDPAKSLEFAERNKPTPTTHQVLIENHAAGVNPIDFKIVKGMLRPVIHFDLPATLGLDVAGTVVQKGNAVTRFAIGDSVYSRVPLGGGTFADYSAVDEDAVARMPSNLTFLEAAGLPLVGLTVIQCFDYAKLRAGDRVLIHAGSGGVGSFAVQYAKSLGAIVFTTTGTDNVDWVRDLGADRVIDYRSENYLEVANDIDLVLDTLGGRFTEEAFRAVKPSGTIVSIAGPLDDAAAKQLHLNLLFRLVLWFRRRRIAKMAKINRVKYKYVFMQPNADQLADITALVEQGAIKPVVDQVFQWDQAIQAITYQMAGRAKGKVIIQIR